jgi:hypothetical protein
MSLLYVKGDRATWLANGYLARMQAIFSGLPAGHILWWSVFHEPENDATAWDPEDWHRIQAIAHKLTVDNRGTKPIYYATGGLIADTPDGGHGGLNVWVRPYSSADNSAGRIPTGYSVGDPIGDAWGLHLYDRFPQQAGRREWTQINNPIGLDNTLDLYVSTINAKGGSITRADVTYVLGETGTERTGQAQADWVDNLISNAAADASHMAGFALFVNDTTGDFAPFPIHSQLQNWVRDETVDGVYGNFTPDPSPVSRTMRMVYDIAGPSVVERIMTMSYDIEGNPATEGSTIVGWGIPV